MKTFMVVRTQIFGTPGDWVESYSSDCCEWQRRARAIADGIEELGHDDFNIATIENGKVVAFGHGMTDFGPDEDGSPHYGHDLARIAKAVNRGV
jgi:hypothetical protein